MIKLSVIMPVYLGEYKDGAKDRSSKFKRAVNSYLESNNDNTELIIISDGCEESELIYKNLWTEEEKIRFFKIKKQKHFSGVPRTEGILKSNADYICYLDSDDMIGKEHLANIIREMESLPSDNHWIYYNVNIAMPDMTVRLNGVDVKARSCGTCSIAHKRIIDGFKPTWNKCDSYGHDWVFIEKNLLKYNHRKGYGMDYIICHQPSVTDV